MIQGVLITIIFLAAVAYLGKVIYQQFQLKSACASGCGKCSVIDFKKIEAELVKKEDFKNSI